MHMMLRDFQEVTELDGQIINLQNELVNLYRKRAAVVSDGTPVLATRTAANWTKQQYDQLAIAWAKYGVKIPSFSSLKTQLNKARHVITKLETAQSELAGDLAIILVPKDGIVNSKSAQTFRAQQKFVEHADFISDDVTMQPESKHWRVVVAYSAPEGLLLGNAEDILKAKAYKVAGYDTRALGISEYVAMTLQLDRPFDSMGWNLLLKGTKPEQTSVTSATFIHNQYRFDTDDASGLLDQESFRPAVEIKAGK
jgi:hypothetical protein